MACEDYAAQANYSDAWIAGEWMDAVLCPYDLQLGTLTFGLFIYGGVMLGLYVRTQSFVVPMTVTILAGTVAVSRLPSGAMQILGIAVLLVITVAGYYIYWRVQRLT